MTTNQDIRRANLVFLIQECAADIGHKRGAQSELSRRTEVPAPFISQFLGKKNHQGGKERAMGEETARKLERGMEKPPGWMDVDRTMAADFREAQALDLLRGLTPEQREAVMSLMRSFHPR